MREVKTPMLDKIVEVKDRSQTIGDFLCWLQNERRVVLSRSHDHDDGCYNLARHKYPICGLRAGELTAVGINTERLLAEFFEIDLDAAEREKVALLAAIREDQSGKV